MLLDTKKEAEEYFEHNPSETGLHFVALSDDELKEIQNEAFIFPTILKTEIQEKYQKKQRS